MNQPNKLSVAFIIERLAAKRNFDTATLHAVKREFSAASALPFPTNSELLSVYRQLVAINKIASHPELERLLTVKPVRSKSGVAIVTLLTMPYPCPGKCIYCPDEVRMPKSYIETEPAAQRALRLQFDPYVQTAKRIAMLEGNGHPADKIELIVKGGTWSSYPPPYQQWFIKECFRAMNDAAAGYETIVNTDTNNPYNRFESTEKQSWSVQTLFDEQKKNETAAHRCIGLTIETRPDFISPQEIKRLRLLGVTRVELGVQTTDDKILETIKRGHTATVVMRATKLLKDAGFKVDFHLMPGLPGATPENDLADARKVFFTPEFQPDTVKLYPTVVTPNTELEEWWKQGRYQPYDTQTLIPLLAAIKAIVPPYVRLSRVIRDIPSDDISAGNKVTNLRETVLAYMNEHGMRCRCLRCREAGHQSNVRPQNITYIERSYAASDGIEYFLSYESEDESILYAFLRLRLPSKDTERIVHLIPELQDAALIRELHTYGQLVPINKQDGDASQHKGLGKKLLAQAETMAAAQGWKKVAVISGIGVREYYRKTGYHLEGTYMVKALNPRGIAVSTE
ncbi:tRNA uridine(34) 5-carboxymethylaminomethyl modification radical SAM/GNAT enzyme Elp3 [Candidatus Uhrbacteria bacterium]|nr:tRNA uridine(34) 5-carboxymethylaminomethyl modification radical SAM/GNAT enzyme Elp3 [Candidatus Uhrbacteria bacterium]